jgi:hypothetical protein
VCRGLTTVVTALLLGPLFATSVCGEATSGPEMVLDRCADSAAIRAALTAAVALLPISPARIAVMDVTRAKPGVREYLLTLDAFTVPANPWIYLVQQSELLRSARAGSKVHIAVLAIVLWHEMAHLSGAGERDARRAEETLWASFIRDGVVDSATGLRYLRGLRHRPDDRLPILSQ